MDRDAKQTMVEQHIGKLKAETGQLKDSSSASSQQATMTSRQDAGEQTVTPYDVSGALDVQGHVLAIDYTKLQREFGTQSITTDVLSRFKQVTGHEPHSFMRRGHFHSH